jgi:hypothetical protein
VLPWSECFLPQRSLHLNRRIPFALSPLEAYRGVNRKKTAPSLRDASAHHKTATAAATGSHPKTTVISATIVSTDYMRAGR